jgi:hypothetical protein
VCHVDGPRLEVVMTGSPTASRMASLLAEVHRKLLGWRLRGRRAAQPAAAG